MAQAWLGIDDSSGCDGSAMARLIDARRQAAGTAGKFGLISNTISKAMDLDESAIQLKISLRHFI